MHSIFLPSRIRYVLQVRAVITKRGGMNGIRTLGRLFRIMDDNGSGTLSYEEVRYGLRDMGLRGEDALNKKVCQHVVCSKLLLTCHQIHLQQQPTYMPNINTNNKDEKTLYGIFDKDKSGTVSFDEFMRAIRGKMRSVVQTSAHE